MVTRDFDAMLAEKAGVRPTFKVAGQEFTVRAKLPYAKWHKLLAVMRADETDAHEANMMFFNAVLIRSDRERFMQLLNLEDDESDDDAGILGMSQLDGITDWLMGHFTGKLQSNTNGSSPGASETGPPPNVVSLSSRTSTG